MRKLTDKQLDRLKTISKLYHRDPHLAEMATTIGRSWSTVRYWALSGKIPFYREGRYMYVPLDELENWRQPSFTHGAKLRRPDVKTIRARKRKGETLEEVYQDYLARISERAFKRVWRGESYQDIA